MSDKPAAYEFGKTFDELEAAFDGRYQFDPTVAALRNPEGRPMTGVLAAKYLVNKFCSSEHDNSAGLCRRFRRLHDLRNRGDSSSGG
jgi:hypothetical protein